MSLKVCCEGLTSGNSRTYTRTGRAKWLFTEACERSSRAASAPYVPCAFSTLRRRECNTNSKFSWAYPVSYSAKVASPLSLDRARPSGASISPQLKVQPLSFRQSLAGNRWTRLRRSCLEPVRSEKGECRSHGTPFDHLRARRDRYRQACLFSVEGQVYQGVGCSHPELHPVFNTLTRTMIIASMMLAVLVCEHVINEETSDGYTHTKGVSCILYNHLYEMIISTGLDSAIIVWDPWSGRRLRLISHAHSVMRYGQHADIEITAACFDDSEQYLATGARNGSLKTWNFNTGVCIRETSIDRQCEITSIVWHNNRILCSSWNKCVTEVAAFAPDVCKKNWIAGHTDHILCSSARPPQVLATATYNGELILWGFETGEPLKKYQVTDVSDGYTSAVRERNDQEALERSNEVDKSIVQQKMFTPSPHQESALNVIRVVAVRAVIFLTTREAKPNVGTLLVALDSGLVQVWTHHPSAGFLGAFSVIHTVGDCATSLATDPENEFLVTGHSVGYIKVWLLSNYMLPDPPKVCMPLLRLKFPFLWKDKIDGRAKRAVRDQKLPVLLSSVRGHMQGIMSLQIIPSAQIILSGSADHTVRLWSFGGRYLSTLGTFRDWVPILPTISVEKYFDDYRLPADIKRFASSTTLKVLHGGMRRVQIEFEEKEMEIPKEIFEAERYVLLYGKEFNHSTLESYYKSQLPSKIYPGYPKLDSTFQYIPIYTHLSTFSLKPTKARKALVLGKKMDLV